MYDVTMERTQVLFTPTQKAQLRRYADDQQTSFSNVVRQAVERFLTELRPKKNTVTALLQRAKHAPKGAPKDLSTNDDYLHSV